jgi:hypothetical protein
VRRMLLANRIERGNGLILLCWRCCLLSVDIKCRKSGFIGGLGVVFVLLDCLMGLCLRTIQASKSNLRIQTLLSSMKMASYFESLRRDGSYGPGGYEEERQKHHGLHSVIAMHSVMLQNPFLLSVDNYRCPRSSPRKNTTNDTSSPPQIIHNQVTIVLSLKQSHKSFFRSNETFQSGDIP